MQETVEKPVFDLSKFKSAVSCRSHFFRPAGYTCERAYRDLERTNETPEYCVQGKVGLALGLINENMSYDQAYDVMAEWKVNLIGRFPAEIIRVNNEGNFEEADELMLAWAREHYTFINE